MTATECPRPAPERPRPGADPTRTGAVWVTGTGALLLLAAAGVFVAVRWAEIPPSAKLAAVGALTGAFLLAGRRLRPGLPATAGALFHLGAFLVPVDVAAVAVRAELGWGALLLVEGLVCGVTFTLAARSEGSVVLRWAAGASAVVAAAGIGAVGPVPAPVVLAVAAGVALLAGLDRPAVAWAAVAGLAPVAGLVLDATATAPGLVVRLGLAGSQPRLAAATTGLVTALVLAVVAHRRVDPALALLAAACATVGAGVTGAELDPSPWGWAIGVCALLAAVEVAALLLRRDRFWGRPAAEVATAAEAVALPGTACAAGVVALAPLVVIESGPGAASAALLAATWLVADLRRRTGDGTPPAVAMLLGGRFTPATIGLAACIPAAVCLATASGPLTAVALLVTAGALLAGGRPWAAGVAAVATTLAPVSALGDRVGDLLGTEPLPDPSAGALVTAALVGIAGSALLARAVAWRTPLATAARRGGTATWSLAAAAALPLFVAAGAVGDETGAGGAALVVAVGLAWLVAALADDLRDHRPPAALPPATATRAVALALALGMCGGVEPAVALLAAAVAAALVLTDALRLDEPRLALGLAAALPVAAVSAAEVAGLTTPRAGVALTLAGVVVAGLGSLAPGRWRQVGPAAAGSLALVGLALATGEPTALADALVVTGGLVAAAGVATDRLELAVAGGATATLGLWVRLAEAGVGASEPYVAPVAALLLLAGLRARHGEAGSWVTTAPAVALLGGTALVERLGGGGGGHALVAGLVGVVAVASGGTWRLGAPLVLGSGLLAVLAAHESLAVTAGVPTWAWLALGGTLLLATGVALERAQLGPVETGRRLVDVVQQRYR